MRAVSTRPMASRYALTLSRQDQQVYLAAYYGMLHPHDGILFTDKAKDACSYVTIEKAAEVARAIAPALGTTPEIMEVNY